ncbi:hypothetical protein E4Z66_13695 [Aliishimia ponticola]|uniref:Uncharacterized protein n=1 Tax=Aliishimia ponticola TaxID=2499833 RepID=A0A4S4NA09_9RHOB|nr:hypothetical protein [Aliishimia ponticola]THH36106.1 hypothetical protein E4Z66_13695 [Aliishimia ponticola]
MFFELIATFVAGLGGAGLVLALNAITGGRLPKWSMPVAAGLAMLAMTIGSEMTWGSRTAGNLPEGVSVVEEVTETAWWRPWTFLSPQVVRLITVDAGSAQTNPAAPDIRLVDMYLFARWQPAVRIGQLVRCAGAPARADADAAALKDPAAATWHPAPPALTALVCKEIPNA